MGLRFIRFNSVRVRWLFFSAALVPLLIAAGCGGATDPAVTQAPVTETAPTTTSAPVAQPTPAPSVNGDPGAGQKLTVAVDAWGLGELNPVQNRGSTFLRDYYLTLLLDRDETGEIVPMLATEWEGTPEGWSWTINPDARWQDGSSVAAEDIKFTFEAGAGENENPNFEKYPQFQGAWAASRIRETVEEVQIIDEHQYLELLKDIQAATGVAIIFITHDMSIVRNLCDRIVVFYGGLVVESGYKDEIFAQPAHPYTEALLRAIPVLGEKVERLRSITGEPPNPGQLPSGCPFHPRCDQGMEVCQEKDPPPMFEMKGPRWVRCWLREKDHVEQPVGNTGTH